MRLLPIAEAIVNSNDATASKGKTVEPTWWRIIVIDDKEGAVMMTSLTLIGSVAVDL